MTEYARIAGGLVAELFTPPAGKTIADCFHADVAAAFVAVPAGVSPAQGWAYAAGAFTAPAAPPPPTLAQQAMMAIDAGLTVTLSGSITLAATLFPTDAATQGKLAAVVTTINATGAFPGGGTSYPMKDAAGAWHTFNLVQYKAVAGAIGAYVAALDLIIDGNPTGAAALPAASVTTAV